MENKVLCAAPWMNYAVNTQGARIICCINSTYATNEKLLDIKSKMLSNERISGCSSCYQSEESSGVSLRTYYNNLYRSENTEGSLWGNVDNLTHYDLSMSNKCNQKCRMCSPKFSTSWIKDSIILKDKFGISNFSLDFKKYSNLNYIEDIINAMSSTNSDIVVKLKGGEPLYLEENKVLLSKMISKGLHKKTKDLSFFTNGTQYDNETIELIKQFPFTTFNLSIDATGKVYEYIRGSNIEWEDCVEKWKTLHKIASRVEISNTVLIYSIFDYKNLKNFIQSNFGNIKLLDSPLVTPPYLSLKLLPDEFRVVLADSYFKDSRLYEFIKKPFSSADLGNHSKEVLIKKFKEYTFALDSVRTESVLEVIPELNVLL